MENKFAGFAAGGRATAVPNAFFTGVLPQIDDPAEMIITLYFFFLWQQVRRYPKHVTYNDLATEAPLRQALSHLSGGTDAALREGLSLAVKRGTVLRASAGGVDSEVYLLNVAAAQKTLQRLTKAQVAETEAEAMGPPPNVFSLYENNIGAISPLIVQDLVDSEERYPAEWLEAAFREAVRQNKRSWRYIQRILERWALEGPDYEETERDPAAARQSRSSFGRRRGR